MKLQEKKRKEKKPPRVEPGYGYRVEYGQPAVRVYTGRRLVVREATTIARIDR